ncbi:hypothetical protein SUGI_0354690 [Cryptomeria japonica]|nr:hypothetical protein SUGI_0354690 [Cryptomeria japonica]
MGFRLVCEERKGCDYPFVPYMLLVHGVGDAMCLASCLVMWMLVGICSIFLDVSSIITVGNRCSVMSSLWMILRMHSFVVAILASGGCLVFVSTIWWWALQISV